MTVHVIGAGLAGVEAARALSKSGIHVTLHEMRPNVMTPAHRTGRFAELVCSNSLRSDDPLVAVGLLKEEMRTLGSIVMEAAEHAKVPAGSSLAVDRDLFSSWIEKVIEDDPLIEVVQGEVTGIDPDTITVIAAGPLASPGLAKTLSEMFEADHLHFYDAVAPIIEKSSIDMSVCYLKSRYDKGEAAYINCPMDKETYEAFHAAIIEARTATVKDFEKDVFEGCMPFEVMAARGYETLLYGPMKPVGLEQPGKKRPYAVVQLRQDDAKATMYNIVGFQTHLAWSEQKAIIRMIPGLENAEILRYGVMHRNTYIDSPNVLDATYRSKKHPNIFVAGQISGVEGYVESAASGLYAGIQAARHAKGMDPVPFPEETVMGAMASYISTANKSFVPMNANFGLMPELQGRMPKKARKEAHRKRSSQALKGFMDVIGWT
jgi:methylenetetrahydrofolate--tRNA-(uracil-5-)-methyltransferase